MYIVVFACLTLCVSVMSPVAVARSLCDGVAICYVLPVLWMTCCSHITARNNGREIKRILSHTTGAARI